MLVANKRQETHFLSNEENEKWIQDYPESETAGARMQGKDAEAAVESQHEDMWKAENVRLTNRES